jgi:multidrug efflux system membrane fusion protein
MQPKPVDLDRSPERTPGVTGPLARHWRRLVVLALLLCAGYWLLTRFTAPSPTAAPSGKSGMPPVPVVAATVRQGDLPVYLTGLGSVTAFNTVAVKSRVDGQLTEIAFHEGQVVHEGDLLAEIDPRPFAVQLTQAEGALARDQALLKDAQLTVARFRALYAERVISKQELDDQAAKVGQYEGAVKADQGLIDSAHLQLTYAHVTAPISGRAGLRLIDVGNVVHATDPNGLVVITQVEPITVLFTLPEDNLPPIVRKLAAGERLRVEAFDRANQHQIATGSLLTTDNQIDQSTGTTRLKAIFDNQDGVLFPNQFVNVRLLLDVRQAAVIAPLSAIQRGPHGTFVYVVKADHTVEVRPVTVGTTTGSDASIESGLATDELVVVDGIEKLRAGSAVQVKVPEGEAAHPAPST